ncbi:MAG: PAS domain S-box protein [Chloroflexaceae bacterium]|nr:PAS domain S-box protein [Chloroflexaceae bacterium]
MAYPVPGTPVGTAVLDRDLRFLAIDEGLAAAHGLSVAAHIGCTIVEIVPDVAPRLEPYLRHVLASGQPLEQAEFYGEQPAWCSETQWRVRYLPVCTSSGFTVAVELVVTTIANDATSPFCTELDSPEHAQSTTASSLLLQHADAEVALLDTILSSAPIGFAFFDPDLRYVRLNEALAEMNGLVAAEHVQRTIEEVIPDLASTLRPLFERVLATGEPLLSLELSGETAKFPGVTRYWLENIYPVRDAADNVLGLGVMVVEITELKKAQAALERSEERFRRVVESRPVGVLFADMEGRITEVNGALLDMLGATPDWLVGKPWVELTPPEYAARDAEATAELLVTGTVQPYEKEYIRADGSRLPILIGVTMLRTADNFEAVGFVLDNTERKRVEAALRESATQLRVVFEQAAVGVAQIETATGRFCHLNQRYCDIVGYTPEEMQCLTFGHITHPDDLAEDLANMERLTAGEIREFAMEKRYIRKDGSLVWVRLTVSPMWLPGTTPDYHVAIVEDISARKQAEERLKLGIAIANFALAEVDYTTDTIQLSPEAAALYGLSSDELSVPRSRVHATFHPEERDEMETLIEHMLQPTGDGWFAREHRVVWPTGEVRWLNVRKQVFFDRTVTPPRPLYALLAARDVTERKQAAEALERSEQQARTLIRTLPGAAMFMVNHDLRYIAADGDALYSAGFTPADFIGKTIFEVLNPEMATAYERLYRQALAGTPFAYEHEAHGRVFLSRGVPLQKEEGTVYAVLAFSLDITERRAAEAALREREERFRTLADNMAQLAWMADSSGWIYWYNQRWYDYTGTTPEKMQSWGWKQVHHPDHVERVATRIQHSWDTGEPWEDTFPLRGKDGQYRWFLSRAVPIRDAKGQIVRWFGTNTDVTEQLAIEATLQETLAREQALRHQAEENNRLKDEFLAMVSHELRTPLTAMLGYAQLLQSRKRDEAYTSRAIDKILQSAKTQAQLIEDLLDVSRIVTGKLRLEPTPLDLTMIIREALDTVRPALEAKGLHLHTELQPAASAVIGDSNRLQQVVWNLLTNAVKFTPTGGTVWVQLAQQGHEAVVSVSDTGVGISAEFLPHVFDRFRQADGTSTRAHGGLGLGLAIVRHLVELHGGSVSASSSGKNQGATFTVRLPLARSGPTARPSGRPQGARDSTAYPPELAGLRVLLVDDQADILDLLQDMLLPCGTIVRTCQDARTALELVQSWQPEVLISDIAMPGEDGYWLISQVRRLAAGAGGSIPAVALTAYVRIEDRLRVLASGFQHYIPKPVEPGELRTVVAQLARQGNETD